MARIASFGSADFQPEEEADTFEYFGEVIRLDPNFSEMDYVDFMEEASKIDDQDVRAITATKDFLRKMVHPDDFQLFWDTARTKAPRGQGLRNMIETANKLLALMTGRPTELPSASSGGQSPTPPSSKPGSSSPGSPLTDMDQRVINRKLESGRPDLALAVLQAAEGRPREQHVG